ncbi:MAG: 1-acyl-sn-glycerol-3-phosphate acyltransferase [Roseivirga sp.]
MMLLRWLSRQLLRALGWQLVGEFPPDLKKAVLIIAPHTSNWDAFYGLQYCLVKQTPIKFAIKKEALFFPLGPILKWMGAVPIDRKRKKEATQQGSMLEGMTALFQQQESLILIIAPEGTRRRVTRWRRGFYQIALQAKVPLILGYIDYAKKQMGPGPVFHPTGDIDKDMVQIKAFYKDKIGKYPTQGVF